jgi:GNAT superfamily N-acetyltransferase
MKLSELLEKVNDKIFWKNFHEEKVVLDGKYKLVAMCGWIKITAKNPYRSEQFRIVVKTANGAEVGWVNFEQHDKHLEALDLYIQPAHRRKGLATEMYKFARELGNDIAPSKLQTGMGKQFWSKIDHATGNRRITEK